MLACRLILYYSKKRFFSTASPPVRQAMLRQYTSAKYMSKAEIKWLYLRVIFKRNLQFWLILATPIHKCRTTPVPYIFASCSRYICFVSEWQRDWIHTIVNAGRIWRYCDQENYFYHHHHTVIVSQLVMQLLTRSVSFLISSEEKDDEWIILSNWDVVSAEWSSCFTSHSLRLWAQQMLVFHW